MNTQLELPAPAARLTDPDTSRAAARSVRKSEAEVRAAIIEFVKRCGPVTAFQIADALARPLGRQHDSIRAAVGRAKLPVCEEKGKAPSGRECQLYSWFL